jgi:O-antigen/teichoic acid export membrane protein
LVIGNVISILVGTSHALMIMAGLEKKALQIQFVRGFLVFLLSFLFIQEYKLDAVVIISLISILFISSFQLYFMKKELNISPFSRELLLLILFSIPFIYFAITQEYLFELYHIIIVPIVVYFIYFSVFHKQIFNLHKELK